MSFVAAFKHPLIGEVLASPAQIGVAEMVVRTVLFLMLLALGGYFFVLFHRRGYFRQGAGGNARDRADDIRIVALRPMATKKYLVAVEHGDRRFLLALTGDRVVKLAEWEMGNGQTKPGTAVR
jgi:flagellar biogenesis protein FliO